MPPFARIADTVPEPARVLGTWLRPFCLGHHLLFTRLGLRYAGAPLEMAGDSELLQAVAICAGESYEHTLDLFLSGKWPAMFDPWVLDLRGPWYARRKVDLAGAHECFREYLAKGHSFTLQAPLWRHRSGGGDSLTAPWEQLFRLQLLKAGLSEGEIMNGYLPARWYDFHTARELDQRRDEFLVRLHGGKARMASRVFYSEADWRAMHPPSPADDGEQN